MSQLGSVLLHLLFERPYLAVELTFELWRDHLREGCILGKGNLDGPIDSGLEDGFHAWGGRVDVSHDLDL